MRFFFFFIFSSIHLLVKSKEEKKQYLWGTYKPHLLFAMTQKLISPITFGLMYFQSSDVTNYIMGKDIRINFDDQRVFSEYKYHNGVDFAELYTNEDILKNEIKIEKFHFEKNYQTWRTVIKSIPNYQNELINMVFYITLPNYENAEKAIKTVKIVEKFDDGVFLHIIGKSNQENFGYLLIETKNRECLNNQLIIQGGKHLGNEIWSPSYLFERNQYGDLNHTNEINYMFFRFLYNKDCTFYISYNSEKLPNSSINSSAIDEFSMLKRKEFDEKLTQHLIKKSEKGEEIYDYLAFTRNIFSSLIGGIIYYSGELLIKNTAYDQKMKEVFSCTPSRIRFPRGFLWDEGL